ncbi:alpha/beta hydrolase [Coraliomargarita parva]|uniref:alpha/beta hydrolase n=1 Tax=Coraliomargarita parva TaxID=3014050 RepID=UPI0022B3B578|nr:alpha/beta hydrolase [Coraliomargarita parva]
MFLRYFKVILFTLTIAYLALMAYAYFWADRLIFPPVAPSYSEGSGISRIQSRDGNSIAFLHLPGPTGAPLLIYSHGNGEDLGQIRPLMEEFNRRGIGVLAYDYPGYGLSSGKASEAGTYAAADAAYQHASGQLGYAPGQMVLYGHSLGSGPSCWLAARYPVGGLVLDGAFSSTFRVMTRIKLLPWDKFDNLKRLASVQCPVLSIHGQRDKVVPFSHAEQNWRALQGRKERLWIENGGHSGLLDLIGARYWETVLPFIQSSATGAL